MIKEFSHTFNNIFYLLDMENPKEVKEKKIPGLLFEDRGKMCHQMGLISPVI